jgi:putative endonuclease
MLSTGERGMVAQARAEAELCTRGYRIAERNFRCPVGEVDLVVYDHDELVFVEVRSRADVDTGRAEETVRPDKQARIARVAQFYLSFRQPQFDSCRFDVVAINGNEIDVFVDAFRPRDWLAGASY